MTRSGIVVIGAEFIISRIRNDLRSDGVQLDIFAALKKISLRFDDDGLEPALNEMADVFVPTPEITVIGKKNLLKEPREIRCGIEPDDEMDMGVHQAIVIDIDSIDRLHLVQEISEVALLLVAEEDQLPIIPPAHDVHGKLMRDDTSASGHDDPFINNV